MINAYFCRDFNHIVLAIFLSFGSTLNAEVLLADDFSKDRLSDSRYYQRFQHDGFKVQGGQLIGSTSAWKNAYLSLIPMAGKEGKFSF